ncbi:MAG: RecT family recombinase [Campylobacter ureolyticus]|nr:RecT family recombinase [Campylobacter ureolyticus]
MNNITPRESEARSLIKNKQSLIKTIVNDEQKISLFSSAILSQAMDKNLQGCSVESVVNTGIAIVQTGLNPNKLFGQAYIVPYGKTAQLQIGYKGWIALGYRNGWKFRSVAVYGCDKFSLCFNGFNDDIDFVPNYEERNDDDPNWVFKNLKGVIVYAKDSTDTVWSEFVSFKKLEKIRRTSPNQKEKLSGVWFSWCEEMYKAKALKYVITRLPINENIMSAVVEEDKPFSDDTEDFEIKNEPKRLNLNEIASQSAKIEPEIIEIEPESNEPKPLPGDILETELLKRGISKNEADEIASRYSNEQIKAILNDPASIDTIINDYFKG